MNVSLKSWLLTIWKEYCKCYNIVFPLDLGEDEFSMDIESLKFPNHPIPDDFTAMRPNTTIE